jgi:uncharacterized protein (DUF1015 family)
MRSSTRCKSATRELLTWSDTFVRYRLPTTFANGESIDMADIRAFRAFRYDLGRSGPLSDVVAPPYDVIDAALQRKLEMRSPHNVVRVDLGNDEPGDDGNRNRYTRSAAVLRDWIQTGVLQQDTARSLYVLHQEYTVGDQRLVRRGFFARVRLEPLGTGQIFPHEQTFAGPKEDRLKLMRATGMNLSPVFAMYSNDGGIQARLDEAIRRTLPLEATDYDGTVSRLWPLSDQALVSDVTGLLGPKPLIIADGHHRYETSLHYLSERRAAGEIANDQSAAQFTLVLLVAMNDPGLHVMPTHRLVNGLSRITIDDATGMLKSHFLIEPASSAEDAWQRIEADGTQATLGFGTSSDNRWLVARLVRPEAMDELASDHSPAWRHLAVSVLHRLVLEKLVDKRLGGRPSCNYVHRLDEVTAAMAARTCDLAVLVPPVTVRQVEEIAGGRETMPQKATYFYPKVPTGLVFNSLKGH